MPQFDLLEKVEVNGNNQNDIWKWMTTNCGFTQDRIEGGIEYDSLNVHDVRWNFEKFLFGRDGKLFVRYSHLQTPEGISDDIDYLLAQ